MAISIEDGSGRKRKRKRVDIKETKRKLRFGEKVEVRSTEEGFSGSWHSATIIACRDSGRLVEYDHLLVDDGSRRLTEWIKVSSVIDGIVKKGQDFMKYRGLIRPIPDKIEISKFSLHYGLCVDALVNEAWWEGVILDYEDGSMERLVFFPDLGDQQMVKIDELRVTKDWDEVNEIWKKRGNWVFLELIEEYEQKWPVVVSVRQIWYELRVKEGFRDRVKEWTCSVKSMWDHLVSETIRHNLYLTAEQVLDAILSENAVNLADQPIRGKRSKRKNPREPKFVALSGNGVVSRGQEGGTQFPLSLLDDPVGNLGSENEEGPTVFKRRKRKIRDSIHVVSEDQLADCTNYALHFSCDPEHNNLINSDSRNLQMDVDKPLSTNTNECCDDEVVTIQIQDSSALPSDLTLFANASSNSIRVNDDAKETRGLVVDYDEAHGNGNDRTFDKADNSTFSNADMLGQTNCSANEKGEEMDNTFSRQDEVQGDGIVKDTRIICWSKGDLRNNKHIDKPTLSRPRDKREWLPAGPDILPQAECCPNALVNYLKGSTPFQSKKEDNMLLALQARMHLAFLGWEIEWRKDFPLVQSKKKRVTMNRFRYVSPDGKVNYSLRKVCESLTKAPVKLRISCSREVHEIARVDAPVTQLSSSPLQAPFTNILGKVQDRASPPCVELLDSGISKRDSVKFVCEPEHCPQAVIDYYELQKGSKIGIKGETAKFLREKAKGHLVALGWNLFYVPKKKDSRKKDSQKKDSRELHYCSPSNKHCNSLFQACERCMKEERLSKTTEVTRTMGSSTAYKFSSALMCTKVMENTLPMNGHFAKGCTESSGSSQSKENLEVAIVHEKGPREHLKRRKDSSYPLRHNGKSAKTSYYKKLKSKNGTGFQLDGSYPNRVLRSSKRARQIVAPSSAHHTPRTVLSWLIESSVVLPRAKVRYLKKKNDNPLAEGRITRDGIKCNCCQKVFGLCGFEVHAGSKLRRPSACIFLEDGRSLLDCQQQVVQDNNCLAIKPYGRIKSNHVHKKNDYICSVCHYGGSLVLCDQCPSSFHLICLGLEDLPDGKWFCPSCRCGICGQGEFHGDLEQSTDNKGLSCDQCNREYHVGCIRKGRSVKSERCPESNWFCSDKCQKIFEGLHKILGKSVPVGKDNLSWTILKSTNDAYHHFGATDIEAMTECQSKLNVALGLIHECFEPIKEPHTRRDLVKDVLFNNTSELNRLNFRGFYTVLLEREDELISVATVRVHGEKVAEVPLVGTCVQYRRQGMCRILFDVLEKKLRELEVERLLLPAVPQVLHTWTTSFGFSKMTNSERLEFLEYTFLDFQDTTMCQKILRTMPAEFTKPRGNQPKVVNRLSQSKENIDVNRHDSIQVIQAEEVELSQIVEQLPVAEEVEQLPVYVGVENDSDSVVTALPLDLVTKLDDFEQKRQNNELGINKKGLLKRHEEKQQEETRFCIKYYRRRKRGTV